MTPYALRGEVWMDSGKVDKLAALLKNYKRNGDRVLIFSQSTLCMNILERVMETLEMSFFRLDGSTNVNERQTMIDDFHDDPSITVFLLSTKAGGAGINLACANKVIIYDMSFNPQEDIQAGESPSPLFRNRSELIMVNCREQSTPSWTDKRGGSGKVDMQEHNRRANSCIRND